MAPALQLSFGSYNITLDRFGGGGAQRTYVDTATLNFSTTGTAIQSGSSRAARRLWAVDLLLNKADAFELQDLYEDWDTARAGGSAAIISLTDQITGRNSFTANTVFTEAVNIELVGNGAPLYRVSFSLTEV
tara:strand:+ start:457 stop:852 length:396 start_codon:yes stop_codon:yes gene_type:complete